MIRRTLRGKCLFGEISFMELSVGEISIWEIVSSGNYPSGNCPSVKCLWKTILRWNVCQEKVCQGSSRQGTVQIPRAIFLTIEYFLYVSRMTSMLQIEAISVQEKINNFNHLLLTRHMITFCLLSILFRVKKSYVKCS